MSSRLRKIIFGAMIVTLSTLGQMGCQRSQDRVSSSDKMGVGMTSEFSKPPLSSDSEDPSGELEELSPNASVSHSFWWNNWPRFTLSTDPIQVAQVNADVVTSAGGLTDEGRGPYFRELDFIESRSNNAQLKQVGARLLGWIEGQGQTRAFVGAVTRNSDGSFVMDERMNAPRLFAHNWTWDILGPEFHPQEANFWVWIGLQSFINNEAWLGRFRYVEALQELPIPKYPDGRSALGYRSGDISDPRNANLYDALSCKDINGQIVAEPSAAGISRVGKIMVQVNGQPTPIGDFSLSKDQASPWWNQYALTAVRDLLRKGVEGFWVDNYSGFDFLGQTPIRVAFGDWSVFQFRSFLAERGLLQRGSASFDVRAYVKSKASEWARLREVDLQDLDHAAYRDSRFLSDPIWKAFLVFKSNVAHTRALELYRGVKSAAQNIGLDPNGIYVGGNDLPSLSFGAIDGNELDQVNTEYTPGWSLDTGPVGKGLPPDGSAGVTWALASEFTKSPLAVVWYYLDHPFESHRRKVVLGQIASAEAIAGNVSLNSDLSSDHQVGTLESTKFRNDLMSRLKPYITGRKRLSEVAILISTTTQLGYMTPGGFYGFDERQSKTQGPSHYLDHNLGVYGWGAALEKLHIPFRVLPDFRWSDETFRRMKVLILPHVRSLSREVVESLLKPFLRRNGTIILSGVDSGTWGGRSELLKDQNSTITELRSWREAQGKVLFLNGNPGFEYHMGREEVERRRQAYLVIQNQMMNLVRERRYSPEISLGSWGEKIRAVLHEQNHGGAGTSTESPFLTVDFVNFNYNLNTDSLIPSSGGELRVRIPASLSSRSSLTVRLWQDGTQDVRVLSIQRSGDQLTFSVPPFRLYGLIRIE